MLDVREVNGRFAGHVITNAFLSLGPRLAIVSTVVVLAALAAAAYLLVGEIFGVTPWPRLALALALTGAVVLSSLALEQNWLWVSGISMSTASVALASLTAWFVLRAANSIEARTRWRSLALAGVGGFVTAGTFEVTGLAIVAVGVIALVALGRQPDRRRAAIASAVGGAFAGLVVVALLPGTAARRDVYPDDISFGEVVSVAWPAARAFLVDVVGGLAPMLAFAAGLAVTPPAVTARRRVVVLAGSFAGALAVTVVTFGFAVWATGLAPPTRSLVVPACALVTLAFVGGVLVPLSPEPRAASAAIALFIAVLGTADRADTLAGRADWAGAWDERDATLRAAGPTDVVRVRALAHPGGAYDLAPDRRFWVNNAVAGYYGVEAVVASASP